MSTQSPPKQADPSTAMVFVPNKDHKLDYTKAHEFGTVVFCTEGELNRKDVASMHSAVALAMEDSDESDYVMIGSLATVCSLACAVFAAKHKRLNLLIYENGRYLERSVLL